MMVVLVLVLSGVFGVGLLVGIAVAMIFGL